MIEFFRCVAEAVMENGVKGLASLAPGGEFAVKVAAGAWKKYRDRKKEADQRKEMEALAQSNFDSAKQEAVKAVREALAEVARTNPQQPGMSDFDRLNLELYLSQIPAVVQQSLRRPEDPTGRTVPSAFALNTPEAVSKLLPLRAPRFKPGDALTGRPGWVLDRPLGVGGFGEVWLAKHQTRTSLVGAVKFCHGQQARDLRHEGGLIDRVMAAGSHHNIVPLRDIHLEGDPAWLMYEYVPGGDLADIIRKLQKSDQAKRVQLTMIALKQLCAAVAHFHRLSPAIVHRDLKPANILFDQANKRLRITDFGIGAVTAKAALSEESRGATTGADRMTSYLPGAHTPLYASPQQRNGEPPDPRDDIHALGVIAFQMLTGDLTAAPGSDLVDELRGAGTPDELIALIGKSVAQRAERRPKDAREWEVALTALMSKKTEEGTGQDIPLAAVGKVPESPIVREGPADGKRVVPPATGEDVSEGQVPGRDGPRLSPNCLAILTALKQRGATAPEKAVSKYLLMAEDDIGPNCGKMGQPTEWRPDDLNLIHWEHLDEPPVPHLTASKWVLWITPAGLRAIGNHVLLKIKNEKKGRVSESTSGDTEAEDAGEKDVWQGFWFVNVGEYEVYDDNAEWIGTNRNWDDCRKYGFLAAGYGEQYSKAMKKLEPGAPVFAYMRGLGYVGYGEVTQAAVMARDFTPEGSTDSLLKLPLIGKALSHDIDDEEQAEWVVGVRWHKTFDREQAKRFVGAFANQNVVCKLRHPETVEHLRKEFHVPA